MIVAASKCFDRAVNNSYRLRLCCMEMLHNVLHWALRGGCKANQFDAIRVASAQKG